MVAFGTELRAELICDDTSDAAKEALNNEIDAIDARAERLQHKSDKYIAHLMRDANCTQWENAHTKEILYSGVRTHVKVKAVAPITLMLLR
jgi:hypothetical protein